MSGRCQESAWKVSGRCQKVLECVRKMSVSCTEGSGEYKESQLQARSSQERCRQGRTGQFRTSPFKRGQARTGQVMSGQVRIG